MSRDASKRIGSFAVTQIVALHCNKMKDFYSIRYIDVLRYRISIALEEKVRCHRGYLEERAGRFVAVSWSAQIGESSLWKCDI